MEIFSKPTKKPDKKKSVVENAVIIYGYSPLREVKDLKYNKKTDIYE